VLGAPARQLEQDVGGALGVDGRSMPPGKLHDRRARAQALDRAEHVRGHLAEDLVAERVARPQPEKERLVERELRLQGQHHDFAPFARHEILAEKPRDRAREAPIDQPRGAVVGPLVGEHPARQHFRGDFVEPPQLERDEPELH
jgi:hypothetical protein